MDSKALQLAAQIVGVFGTAAYIFVENPFLTFSLLRNWNNNNFLTRSAVSNVAALVTGLSPWIAFYFQYNSNVSNKIDLSKMNSEIQKTIKIMQKEIAKLEKAKKVYNVLEKQQAFLGNLNEFIKSKNETESEVAVDLGFENEIKKWDTFFAYAKNFKLENKLESLNKLITTFNQSTQKTFSSYLFGSPSKNDINEQILQLQKLIQNFEDINVTKK